MDQLAATMQEQLAAHPHTRCVRGLAVEVNKEEEELVLKGRSPDYYRKQLAQHFAMQIAGGVKIKNLIEVG